MLGRLHSARAHSLVLGLASGALLVSGRAAAQSQLTVTTARLDRPTLVALGVQVLIAGDDNFNGAISVRYRMTGSDGWQQGLPLWRVHPEVVTGRTVPAQFAGSLFDLVPKTSYDIQLRATDPDGPVDQTLTLTGTTRPVPRTDPAVPRVVAVTTAAELDAALGAAAPGDVITLAPGIYAGEFAIEASGTAENPIVIRGASRDQVILDGGNAGANVLEIYGSYLHTERLTLQHDNRGLRFQGAGTTGNVVRRVHIRDVVLGVGSRNDQTDFYLCDNWLEGRLTWPAVYSDDGGVHANDDGIDLQGHGHVICHNLIGGFGDSFKLGQDGTRVFDFYGNQVTSSYDNGVEFDGGEGNLRCFRNRFTNTYATLSFQPVFGGPAYAFRNVVVNVADEQMKLHALGATDGPLEPSGVLVYHNTFVSPAHAIQLSTSDLVHYFEIANNLFIGPALPTDGLTVNWDTPMDVATASIDYNGYYPNGQFRFGYGTSGARYADFAAMVAAGRYETHGVLLPSLPFESSLAAPATYTVTVGPPNAALASGSPALDQAKPLANINPQFVGNGPDLGALERGCPEPLYGIRPEGVDESSEVPRCGNGAGGAGGTSSAGTGGGTSGVGGAPSTGGATASGGATALGGATTGGRGGASGEATAQGGLRGAGGSSAWGGGALPEGGQRSGGAGILGGSPARGAGGSAGGVTSSDQGGCSCSVPRGRARVGAVWLLGLLAVPGRRRRMRAPPPHVHVTRSRDTTSVRPF